MSSNWENDSRGDRSLYPPKGGRGSPVGQISAHPDTALEGLPQSLAREERSSLLRLMPRRSRWPELAEFDTRGADLDQRRQAATEELQRITQERHLAPERDARELADWIAACEKGSKPKPSAPELDRRIEELARERDALTRAADDELERKAGYVAKHRQRLVREADARVAELRQEYERLVDAMAKTREELAETRSVSIWAAIYPSRAAAAAPPRTVAGGLRRVLERAGVTSQVNADAIWDLLRADAEWLAQAATHEQLAELGVKRPDEAVWNGTPEGLAQERAERKAARRRYKALWGREPA